MKRMLLTLLATLTIGVGVHAQMYRVENNSGCDLYMTFYYFNTTTSSTPTGNSVTYFFPAGTNTGITNIGMISWKSGTPVCGWQLGYSMTEDLSCGTGGTGISYHGSSPTFTTTCSSNPGCPQGTNIVMAESPMDTWTWPNGGPGGGPIPTCSNGLDASPWDVFFNFHN